MSETRLDPSTAADRDSAFEALANARRRLAVRVLAERDCPLAVADLARAVARRERTADEGADGTPVRPRPKTVATQLHHRHVPKLVAAGLVERDPERGTVELVVHPDVLADLVGSDGTGAA